jgi:formylglycine-generating enzyme
MHLSLTRRSLTSWCLLAITSLFALKLLADFKLSTFRLVSSDLNGCHLTDTQYQHSDRMVWVPGGSFMMGAEYAYSEEGPAHFREVDGFWIGRFEVTNAEFTEFVEATGYLTLAERGSAEPGLPPQQRQPGSAVFMPPLAGEQYDPWASWWRFVSGANWRHPEGPGSDIDGLDRHPVVHVAYEDAQAYADWKGHRLPTEAEFEFAAQSSRHRLEDGSYVANTWQGFFPFQHEAADGFSGSAPAGCYIPNELGLYDLIGNVWEWTSSAYYQGHDFPAVVDYPEGLDPAQPGEAVAVIKGGSYLCAPNYCMRYRPEARQGQSKGLGTSHIGFRTAK